MYFEASSLLTIFSSWLYVSANNLLQPHSSVSSVFCQQLFATVVFFPLIPVLLSVFLYLIL